MESVEETLVVDVPVRQAYDQWTRFESFPAFMEGIDTVEQVSDTLVRFRGEIGGKNEEWTAKIVEQVPDERVQWRSVEGAKHGGTVLFEPHRPDQTKITLFLDYEPETFTEKVGDAFGFFQARVKKDLHNFKEYIEERARAEGGWRGEVHGGVRTD